MAQNTVQLKSLEGQNWYPITLVENIEGLDAKLEDLEQKIEDIDITDQLGDYVKTSDVETKISGLRTELEAKIETATDDMLTKTEAGSTYATKEEIPTDFYSKSEVDGKLTDLETKLYGSEKVSDTLNTITEIGKWAEEHQGVYETLETLVNKKVDKAEILGEASEGYQTLGDIETLIKSMQNEITSLKSELDKRNVHADVIDED